MTSYKSVLPNETARLLPAIGGFFAVLAALNQVICITNSGDWVAPEGQFLVLVHSCILAGMLGFALLLGPFYLFLVVATCTYLLLFGDRETCPLFAGGVLT